MTEGGSGRAAGPEGQLRDGSNEKIVRGWDGMDESQRAGDGAGVLSRGRAPGLRGNQTSLIRREAGLTAWGRF